MIMKFKRKDAILDPSLFPVPLFLSRFRYLHNNDGAVPSSKQ